MKIVIVIIAIVFDSIYIIYNLFFEIEKFKVIGSKKYTNPCTKLENERCTSPLWRRILYDRNKNCARIKCPGYIYVENGKETEPFSFWSIPKIVLKQAPALSALALLLLKLLE
ncbi:MAG: hypothetical protein IJM37_07680 [Lachnospiraceae bacterium]|nr:hypothetical protein [Lachnospiraceae bacterium]